MTMVMRSLGRGKVRRMVYLGIIHITGAILGGGIVGGLLGGLGALFSLSVWRFFFLIPVIVFALWQSLTKHPARLGFYWQQVPRIWARTLPAELCYFFWGILLGSGIATVIPYSALLVVFTAQLTSGLFLGCLSGAVFGGMRELVALLPLFKKQYRLSPERAGVLLPKLTPIVTKLNILWIIGAGSILLFTSWH